MFARQNNREDVRPWAIINALAPIKLHGVWIMMSAMARAMWFTEE